MASKVLILFFTSLLSLSNVTTPQVAEVPQIREESTAPTVSEDSTEPTEAPEYAAEDEDDSLTVEEKYEHNTFNDPHPELTVEQCLNLLNRYAWNAYWGLATKETYCNMSFVLSIGKEMNSKVRIMEAMSACGTGICREKYEEYESEKRTHKFEC